MKTFFLSIIVLVIASQTLITSAFAQNEVTVENLHYLIPKWLANESPLEQHISGISASSTVCQGDLQLIIKNEDGFPACVKPETANILLEHGWAKNTISTIYGVLEQNYQNMEYGNGTIADSYDIYVKTDITNMSSILHFQVFFSNGTLYRSDDVPIRDVQQDGYKYHIDIKPNKNINQDEFKTIISYNNDSSVVYMPRANELHDVFGVSEIYPTKKDGAYWYMNTDNITNDMSFSTIPEPNSSCNNPMLCTLLYKNLDGNSWHAKRIDVPENEGIRLAVSAPPNTLWLNTEMTGYYKLENSTYYPQEFTHVIRSGSPHSSICLGYSYYLSITYDGNLAEIQKSLYHAGDTSSYSQTFVSSGITTPLSERWVGMKTIVYNINDTAVKLEIWIDDQNNNNWHMAFEQIDTGWSVPGNPAEHGCKNIQTGRPMSSNDVISWGGTEQQFRADDAEMDFKNLSIREIDPPTS